MEHPQQRNTNEFVAGGSSDPASHLFGLSLSQRLALCSNPECKGIIAHCTHDGKWVDDSGRLHSGHVLELQAQHKQAKLPPKQIKIGIMSPVVGLSPLLGHLVCEYQKPTREKHALVGEGGNILQIFLAAETRYLPRHHRQHVVATGDTGLGKSELVRRVIMCPAIWRDVLHYTRITGPGLDRMQGSLDGKILFYEQLGEGQDPNQLKFAMTEGALRVLSSERSESGKWVSSEHLVPGEPVLMSTCVPTQNLDRQLLNRTNPLTVDESDQQTRKILESKLLHSSKVIKRDESELNHLVEVIDEACKKLGPAVVDVKIPFAVSFLEKLPIAPQMRRAVDHLTNLISSIAFLKTAVGLRGYVQLKPSNPWQVYVVATPEDVTDALFCVGRNLADSVGYFVARSREVLSYIIEHPSEDPRQVARGLTPPMSQNRSRELLNWLVEWGYATKERQGASFHYEATGRDLPQIDLKPSFSESDLESWIAQNFDVNEGEVIQPTLPVVLVVPEFKLEPTTISEIVAETPTIKPIVPELNTNHSIVADVKPNRTTTNTTEIIECNPQLRAKVGTWFINNNKDGWVDHELLRHWLTWEEYQAIRPLLEPNENCSSVRLKGGQ